MFKSFVIPVEKTKTNNQTLSREKVLWYKCLYCSREYPKEEDAGKCVDTHELVLVPIARNDLGRLNQFLYLKEDKLLTESLVRTIQKYSRKQR